MPHQYSASGKSDFYTQFVKILTIALYTWKDSYSLIGSYFHSPALFSFFFFESETFLPYDKHHTVDTVFFNSV